MLGPAAVVIESSSKRCSLCPSLAHETLSIEVAWDGGGKSEHALCLPCGIALTEGERRVIDRLRERALAKLN
jgi:hypothetical protein